MPERPLNGLLVDYGGVLTTPVTHSFRAFCRESGLPSELVKEAFVEAYRSPGEEGAVHRLETGQIEADEFAGLLCDAIEGRTGVRVEAEGLLGRLFATVELDERMLRAVERLRDAGVRTGLLSNSWGPAGYPRERFPVLFDAIVISGEVGMRKPDPRIFLHAAQELDLPPSACVFVDDLDHNVAAAQSVGLTAIVHRDPDDTIPRLAELFRLDVSTLSGKTSG